MADNTIKNWRTSKYPLRFISRSIFLTYIFGALLQIFLTKAHLTGVRKLKAGGFEYLTLIGLLGTIMTLFVSTLNEFFPFLKSIKVAMNSLFLTIEVMISILYWSLYLFNPALILDPRFIAANGLPHLFLDTSVHLVPAISMIFEFFQSGSSKKHLRNQRVLHLSTICIFSLGYFLWLIYLFDNGSEKNSHNLNFPYPFLSHLTSTGRTIFAVCSMFTGLFIFAIVTRAYNMYHPTKKDIVVEKVHIDYFV